MQRQLVCSEIPIQIRPIPNWDSDEIRVVIDHIKQNSEQIQLQKLKPTLSFDDSPSRKDTVKLKIYGVPCSVKRVESTGVWRHYTSALDAILQQRVLRSTRNPYVRSESDRYRETYPSLYGIFITKQVAPLPHIGVHDFNPFIDFEMAPNTPLLFLSEGIYLIPAQDEVFELPVHIVGAGRYVRE